MQNTNQWFNAAKAELDGADPYEKLSSAKGNLRIKPWYDRFDVQEQQSFILPPEKSWLGARAWVNAPLIKVEDAASANKKALQMLATGADGILFEFEHDSVKPEILLHDIQLEYCSVFFKGSITERFARELFASSETANGAFYNFTLHESNESPEISLAKLLVSFVEHFDSCNNVPRAIEEVAVLSETGNDFFLEIAKLKALRVLWNGLCKAYGVPCKQLMIHSIINSWISDAYQPHGNMIAETSRTLAAVLGGCNAVTVIAENSDDTTTSRIARNVSLVLRDESHISKTADATAGSYYIDSLVRDIVEKSWVEFQKRCR